MKIKTNAKLFIHGVVNCILVVVIAVTILCCSVSNNEEVATVFKSYNGVIYAGNEKTNKVALMINVYWGTEYLEEMLSILDEHNVKVTFFVGQTWVKDYPEILKRMYQSGHEIGNHGANHKEHAKLSLAQNVEEIQKCHNEVKRVLGIDMNLFAPPGGSYNNHTTSGASSLGYQTILWTQDTIDWRDKNEELIYSRATSLLASGDLILMHPTEATKNVLERIILAVKSKKLTLDTVSNTIKE